MMQVGAKRPLQPSDIPQIGGLFLSAFRRGKPGNMKAFEDYLHALFFTHPCYELSLGGAVYQGAEGRIDAVYTAIPMRFRIHDQTIVARLVCTFMTSPHQGPNFRGAAELALGLRPRRQDLCFTDSASPVTADHFRAVDGAILPVHGLEWHRVFRPAAFLGKLAGDRFGRKVGLPLHLVAPPVDRMLTRFRHRPDIPADGLRVQEVSSAAFAEAIDDLLADYPIRPLWSPQELNWISTMASDGRAADTLHFRTIQDRDSRACGAFVFYGREEMDADVLNIFSRKGHEKTVVECVMRHLQGLNFASVKGRADPKLLDGLSSQKWLFFRHGAHVCVSSRHAQVINAIARNEIYIGGLAGEGWSRLTRDFF